MSVAVLDKCRVSGPLLSPDGMPIGANTLRFTLTHRERENGVSILPLPIEVDVDDEGNFEVDLWPNVSGNAGTVYKVLARSGQTTITTWTITVPDADTANLADISDLVAPPSIDDAQAAAFEAQAALVEIRELEDTIEGYTVTLQPLVDNIASAVIVAGITDQVVALGAIAAQIETVGDNMTSVVTVAGISADVVTVAGISADVVTVAGISVAVQSVADNMADILAAEGNAAATAADRVATGQDRTQTNADVLSTNSNVATSTADKNAAAVSAANALTSENGATATKIAMDVALANVAALNPVAELTPAARQVVSAADVIDFFIYDTTQDSDGGKWRYRCDWSSWMKEALSTATRGARKLFPQKALIVARAGSTDTVTIYDMDQASCPMWMVFTSAAGNFLSSAAQDTTSLWAANGFLYVGQNGNGLRVADFVRDYFYLFGSASVFTQVSGGVGARNSGVNTYTTASGTIVNQTVNDVAAIVLPGTPVDKQRRLPSPTVAVATAGGVSVIHWDGRVANSAITGAVGKVAFGVGGNLYFSMAATSNNVVRATPAAYAVASFSADRSYNSTTVPAMSWVPTIANALYASAMGAVFCGIYLGLGILREQATMAQSSVAYISSKFNTGYMVGDTKLALAESTVDLTSLVQGATDFVNNTELMTGGTFEAGLIGTIADGGSGPSVSTWTINTSSPISGTQDAKLVVTGGSVTWPRVTFNTTPAKTVGKKYQIKFDYKVNSGSPSLAQVYNGSGTTTINAALVGTGTCTAVYTAAGTTALELLYFSGSAYDVQIDNVSVKEVVTTVLYDDFGGYADTAAMLAAGWVSGVNAALTLVSGKLRVTNLADGVSGFTHGARSFATVVGRRYQITIRFVTDAITGNTLFRLGNSAASASISETNFGSAVGVKTIYFTATAATTWMTVMGSSSSLTGEYHEFDDIRVDLVVDDRSVAGNNPLVYGTVTRTAVATGAELAAYGGFSASNYFSFPWTGLSPATGDFCLSLMFTAPTTVNQDIVSVGDGSASFPFWLRIGASGSLVTGAAGVALGSALGVIVANQIYHVVVCRRSGQLELWLNGVLLVSGTRATTIDLANATLRIGNGGNSTSLNTIFGGVVANLRWGFTAPTPQQIRDMATTELLLSQPNAKCLLPADSVSALAYDDSTDLLHVATTAGMARLKDLLVVSKDAIVVTGIEARSGIVATRDTDSADVQLPSLLLRPELMQPDMQTPYDRDKVRASGVTTNATPVVVLRLPMDKGERGQWTIRSKVNQYGDGAAYAAYIRSLIAYRPEEGNIALRGAIQTLGTDVESTGTMDLTVVANTTLQTLDVTATGLASTNLEWDVEAVRS